MSQIEAIRAALQAAENAGLIESWEEDVSRYQFDVRRQGATRTLTMHGVQTYLSQWIADEARERPPVIRTWGWMVLLNCMEDLAETCRWWGVSP